jgi:hypothetical protein
MTKDHAIRSLLALTAAAALAACGGSIKSTSSSAAPPSVASAQPSTSSSTPPASTPSQTTGARTSPTPAGPLPCRAAQLQLSFLGGQAATGHGLLGFQVRNTGASSCHTYGYPGVLFLDRAGAPLPTAPSHATTDFFGTLPLARVTLPSGATASFRLGVTHGISSTAGCTTAYGLQVIPPDDTATIRVTIPNGAYECRTVTVSPLVLGSSANP